MDDQEAVNAAREALRQEVYALPLQEITESRMPTLVENHIPQKTRENETEGRQALFELAAPSILEHVTKNSAADLRREHDKMTGSLTVWGRLQKAAYGAALAIAPAEQQVEEIQVVSPRYADDGGSWKKTVNGARRFFGLR